MARTAPLRDSTPPGGGIMQCLRLLTEDAASLGLPRTHLALCQVLRICEAECAQIPAGASPTQR